MVSLLLQGEPNLSSVLARVAQTGLIEKFHAIGCPSSWLSEAITLSAHYNFYLSHSEIAPENRVSCASLASKIDSQRQAALRQVAHVVSLAKKAQVREIVLWPARVETSSLEDDYHELQRQFRAGADISSLRTRLLQERARFLPGFVENLCRSLYQILNSYPEIFFSLPSSWCYFEIPLQPIELEWILEELHKFPNLGYWHHSAAMHLNQKKGLTSSLEWLAQHGKKVRGVHLEDVVGHEARMPAGVGEVNFQELAEYLPRSAIRVVSVDHKMGEYEIMTALNHLKEQGILPLSD